ncbi:M48 family metallopeptidase [Chloroflexota bacterium]
MNPFLVIILIAILLEFVINLVANLLNLKALKLEVPAALKGIYNPDEYRNSQQYTSTVTRFAFVASASRLALLLAFWFGGGFNYLDQIIRSWGFVPIANGLSYVSILLFAYSLVTLPFSIYATFVIEERFGFNRTTPVIFIKDRLKGLALALLLGAPLLAIVLALFEYAGYYAWLYCWVAITIFSLAVQYVAPTWIMPLFNKFTPMEPGELKEAILQYARSVKFPVRNVLVMDGSKRSSKSNAFFTGFGRNKRIALFDTMIEKYSVSELVAVLAHEIGHYKKKHILQGTIISILHMGVILFLLSIFMDNPGLYEAFYMEQPSIYTGLLFFGLLYTPVELMLSIVFQVISRKNEYQADRFAAGTTDEPENLANALKKLSADHLSNLTPHPVYVFLNYSHPPLLKRIEALKK